MRIVVTGGSGFVGRHVVASAAERGWHVAGAARSPAAAANIAAAGGTAIDVPAFDDPRFADALQGADAVVHLAMIGSERDGSRFEDVNVAGTKAVVAAARAAGLRRLVLFSGLGVARYGQAPRSTNRYFLSKVLAEAEAFRGGMEVVTLRPSYIVGPGDGFITFLLRQLREGVVDRAGDGAYRLQPAAVRDAAHAALAAVSADPGMGRGRHRVIDLVGPVPVAFRDFVPLVAEAAGVSRFRWREVPVADAERAAGAGGWNGLPPEDLDVLLCDEVGDPRPLTALLGRPLATLEEAVRLAVAGTT